VAYSLLRDEADARLLDYYATNRCKGFHSLRERVTFLCKGPKKSNRAAAPFGCDTVSTRRSALRIQNAAVCLQRACRASDRCAAGSLFLAGPKEK
jgi:hypothetical protein